jgi:hypothetical protein
LVIKALDPDEMNADPQPCFTLTKQLSLSLTAVKNLHFLQKLKKDQNQRCDADYIWQLFLLSRSNNCKYCMHVSF